MRFNIQKCSGIISCIKKVCRNNFQTAPNVVCHLVYDLTDPFSLINVICFVSLVSAKLNKGNVIKDWHKYPLESADFENKRQINEPSIPVTEYETLKSKFVTAARINSARARHTITGKTITEI